MFSKLYLTFSSISSWYRRLAPAIRVWATHQGGGVASSTLSESKQLLKNRVVHVREYGTVSITSKDNVILKSGNSGVSIFLKKKKKKIKC